jgi:hypothetical protein
LLVPASVIAAAVRVKADETSVAVILKGSRQALHSANLRRHALLRYILA